MRFQRGSPLLLYWHLALEPSPFVPAQRPALKLLLPER